MSDRDALIVDGVVAESFRGDRHAVDITLPNGRKHRVLARRCGRLVHSYIRLLPGDRVQVELSPYDPGKGRIMQRLDKRAA